MKKETGQREGGSNRTVSILVLAALAGLVLAGTALLSAGPDLTASSPVIMDETGVWQYEFSPGDALDVRFYTLNQGRGRLPAGRCEYGVYLSDVRGSRPERFLGTNSCRNPGRLRNAQNSWRGKLPDNLQPGEYYITVRLDPDDLVREQRENNNVARGMLLVSEGDLAQNMAMGL